jgi:dsRNA-specific ribonuclease
MTLQGAHAGYNNQRLETLGDAVLQLCTTVHLFNIHPHRHEGQLSSLRRMIVSNRFLSARAWHSGWKDSSQLKIFQKVGGYIVGQNILIGGSLLRRDVFKERSLDEAYKTPWRRSLEQAF